MERVDPRSPIAADDVLESVYDGLCGIREHEYPGVEALIETIEMYMLPDPPDKPVYGRRDRAFVGDDGLVYYENHMMQLL